MAHEITNNERFWFIVFTLWCMKHDKDHKTEDFNQIKSIPDEEYNALHVQAVYVCLKAFTCGTCWEKFDRDTAGFKQNTKKPHMWTMKCPHCGMNYKINMATSIAEAWEDE